MLVAFSDSCLKSLELSSSPPSFMRLSLRQPQDYFSYCLVFKSMPMVAVPAQASSLKRATKILQLLSSSMKRDDMMWKQPFWSDFPCDLSCGQSWERKSESEDNGDHQYCKWCLFSFPPFFVVCVDITRASSFTRPINGDSEIFLLFSRAALFLQRFCTMQFPFWPVPMTRLCA